MKKNKIKGISTDVNSNDIDNKEGIPTRRIRLRHSKINTNYNIPWSQFIQDYSIKEIQDRFLYELKNIFKDYEDKLSNYCFLSLIDSETSIGTFDLDKIYSALSNLNPDHSKDVFLLIHSQGGSIEPSYQISKLCKAFSKNKFIVSVPRKAKSAATLISLGADQIHMGPLGQLGPIDPQLDGLPALGVSQALESIASVSEKYPGSSDMFARYLRMVLTVEQIGYCERISDSAAQYAERLLSSKPSISKIASNIARVFVHEFKDHGFVIDIEEARKHLGADWILDDTDEILFAEDIYKLFDNVSTFLRIYKNKRIIILGQLATDILILDKP